MSDDFELETLALHTGIHRSQFNEHAEALYLTSSFVFESAAQAAARFSGAEPGNIYSRFTNPTVTAFEERLAALEGGLRHASPLLPVCRQFLRVRWACYPPAIISSHRAACSALP